MNFNFGDQKGTSQSSGAARLEGNKIHEVTFEGCEERDIQGVQDASVTYNVLDIKFKNSEGLTFTHTIWEPKDSDYQDTPNAFGGNNPSNVLAMRYLIAHLLDAVNPEWDPNSLSVESTDSHILWLKLRKAVCATANVGIGTTTKIKLLKNKKGEPTFPSFFVAYNRENKPYMKTNFIGNNVYFLNKELDQIKKSEEAKPTNITSVSTGTEDLGITSGGMREDTPANTTFDLKI